MSYLGHRNTISNVPRLQVFLALKFRKLPKNATPLSVCNNIPFNFSALELTQWQNNKDWLKRISLLSESLPDILQRL